MRPQRTHAASGRRPPVTHQARMGALVCVGGMAGTASRAVLEQAFATSAGTWPWATFAINVTGAFLLGCLLEVLARRGADTGWRRIVRLTAGTGFLGGYTTYSTFAVETLHLSRAVAGAYVLATTVLGALAAAAGYVSARRMTRPRPEPGR